MKHGLKRVLAVLMLVAFLAGTIGCSATNPPKTNEGGTNGTDQPAPNNETNTSSRSDKSIIAPVNWPAYIDPAVGSKGADSIALVNLYDSLTFPNPDGTISPSAAKSWDVNEDSTVYTFHLRDDIVFHSGNKLTANDVKYSMDRLLTIGEGYAYLFIGVIQSTEVLDDYTIRFTLTGPSGTLPAMLIRLYILDEAVVKQHIDASGTYSGNGDYAKTWLLTNDAGSGPYKVKEMRTEEYLIIERYAEYWQGFEDGAPEIVKMVGGVDSTTMRTLFSRGEIDYTDDAQTNETYDTLAALEGATLVRAPMGVNFTICLNTKKAPTDDVHLRKAIAYAFDYQSVADNIYIGSVKATGPIVQGLAAAALTEAEMPYSFDLDKAKAELEQSPYYDQLISGEMTVSLTWCSEGGSQQEKLALLIQSGLAAIGVKVEITGKPFATMMTDAQTVETTPNASLVVFAPPYLDGGGYLKARYHSSSCGSWEQMEWLQNPEIDAMIEEALTIADESARNAMYKEISRKLVELCPSVWMVDLASTYVYRSDYVTHDPTAQKYLAGENFIYAMGYSSYYRDFKVN